MLLLIVWIVLYNGVNTISVSIKGKAVPIINVRHVCTPKGAWDLVLTHINQTVSASRLVMSPDSHTRESRSRLGGRSWFIAIHKHKRHCRVQWNNPHPERNVMNPKQLSEDEEFNEIRTAHSEGSRLTMKRNWGGLRQALQQGEVSRCNMSESPFHCAGERKTPWGKPGERYKHRWGKVRLVCCFCGFKAQQCLGQRYGLKTLSTTRKPPKKVRHASRWGPWKPTTYGAFPLHTRCSITSSWPLKAKSSAMPGCHIAGWANEPRGWIQLLLL